MRKLRKVSGFEHKWVGGVCGGVAYVLGMNVWMVRLIWFVLMMASEIFFIIYLLLWFFLPKWESDPSDFNSVTGD